MQRPTSPNIVWFTFEDTSPRFGCYGDDLARRLNLTPNVDALAAGGTVFRRCFSTAPVCAPSRFATITGFHAHAAGACHMRTTHTNADTPGMTTPYEVVPPPEVRCVSETLRAAGYYCTNNNKTDYQFAPPRGVWDACSPDAHWRNRPDPQMPFFAVFNYGATHESGMWDAAGTPDTDPAAVDVPPYLVDGPGTRRAITRQYDHIAAGDAALGVLLRQLEEDGVADDTVVFVWSDHGEGLPRRKRWPLDGGTHVPLVLRAGRNVRDLLARLADVEEEPVSLIDLVPTVLDLARLPRPTHLHGRSLLTPPDGPSYAFATRDRYDEAYDRVRSVRDRRFRYVRNERPDLPYLLWIPYSLRHPAMHELWHAYLAGTLSDAQALLFATSRPPEELYDLDADPHEVHNLADDLAHASEKARLRDVLDTFLALHGDLGRLDEKNLVERFWPEGVQPRTEPVTFVPLTPEVPAVVPVRDADHVTLAGPARLLLHCPTDGACVSYHTGDRWRLYVGPITLEQGTTTVRACAHRYGYSESDERVVTFDVAADMPREAWRVSVPAGLPLNPPPAQVAANVIACR